LSNGRRQKIVARGNLPKFLKNLSREWTWLAVKPANCLHLCVVVAIYCRRSRSRAQRSRSQRDI